MKPLEFKLGPKNVRSLTGATPLVAPLAANIIICTAFIELCFILAKFIQTSTLNVIQTLQHPSSVALILWGTTLAIVSAVVSAKRLAYGYARFEKDNIVYYRNFGHTHNDVYLTIPHSSVLYAVLSEVEGSCIYYKGRTFSLHHLPSVVGLGQRSKVEIEEIRKILAKTSPGAHIHNSQAQRFDSGA